MLDSDQQRAVEILTDPSTPICVMTGGPGVGKTHTLNAVVNTFDDSLNVALCSPTGKAAKRLMEATGRPAKTIHSLLKGAPGMGFEYGDGNPLDADVVIVDEASMVDVELMAALVAALRPGARLLLVGDANQLPPVGPGQPFTDIIRSGRVPVAYLTQIHRQKGDSWVLDNAYRIINGQRPNVEDTHDFTLLEVPSAGTKLSEEVVKLAVEVLEADPDAVVLSPQNERGAGVLQINLAAQKAFLGDPKLGETVITLGGGTTCRKGDRVMVVKNMKVPDEEGTERYLPNGMVGECLDALGQFRGRFRFDSNEFMLGGDKLKLTLAYAMSIHRAQGSGWDHVVVIADPAHAYMLRSMGRQLIYTAVTRVQKRLTVIGSGGAFQDVALGEMSNLRETYLKQFYA